MHYRLRRHEKEALRREYGDDVIFRALLTPCRSYEAETKGFCVSAEEVFMEVLSVLDAVKENPDEAFFNIKGLWDELYVDYRDLAEEGALDEMIQQSVGIVLQSVALCLEMLESTFHTTLAMEIMRQMALHDLPSVEMIERFTVNIARLREGKLRKAIADYMESDLFLSDEISDYLQSLPNPLKLSEPNEKKNPKDVVEQLTNRQLMILFDLFFNKGFSTEYCNQKALAALLSRVSGRSEGSIRQKIREGVDYETEEAMNDVRLLAELLKPIDERLSVKMQNLIE